MMAHYRVQSNCSSVLVYLLSKKSKCVLTCLWHRAVFPCIFTSSSRFGTSLNVLTP